MNIQFSLSTHISTTPSAVSGSIHTINGRDIDSVVSNPIEELKITEAQSSSLFTNPEQQMRRLESVYKEMMGRETTLDISIHEKTNQIMVKVLNKETGELIREVPPEKIVNLVASMMEMAGIIIDKKL